MRREWGPVAVSLALVLWASLPAQAGEAWDLSGRVGVEVDALGERFGSSTLFDVRLDPDNSLEGEIESRRFRSESTRTSGLLHLRLEHHGERWFRLGTRLKSSPALSRGDLDLDLGAPTAAGVFSLTDQLYLQGGREDAGSGVLHIVRGSWIAPFHVAGVELRAIARDEQSRTGVDSLAALFDYRLFRPSLELRRSLGLGSDLSLQAGVSRKWVTRGASAYRGRWVEADWTRFSRDLRRMSLRLRSEGRRYLQSDSLSPSYQENRLEGFAETKLYGPLRGTWEEIFQNTQYAVDSEVFADHWSLQTSLGLETDWRDLFGSEEADSSEGEDLLLADWTFSLALRHGLLRHEQRRDNDYQALSGVLSVSRDGISERWLTWSGELGRRRYRASGRNQNIIFEGLNLSLSGTDYTFFSTSLLAQIGLPAALRFDLFSQYDVEVHSAAEDDFTLWMITASLSRSF